MSGFVLDATFQARNITVQHYDAVRLAYATHVVVGIFAIPLGNLG
jgi:hypothetical protein